MSTKLTWTTSFLLAFLAWSSSTSVSAEYLNCMKPNPPMCIDQIGGFDEWSFQQCQNEVEFFVQQVQQFQQCVIYEAERINSDAQQEANRVVERFNCKAQGESFCP